MYITQVYLKFKAHEKCMKAYEKSVYLIREIKNIYTKTKPARHAENAPDTRLCVMHNYMCQAHQSAADVI